MRPHRLLATLGALALTCSLAACSDEPQPIIEATPSTGPTSDPPPSSTPTATPDPDEPESAKDFIRRWQKEAFAMQVSGDTGQYLAMASDCESCDILADSVQAIYQDGGFVQLSGSHSVTKLERVGKVGRVSIYEYVLKSPRSEVLDANGAVENRFTGGTNRYQVNVIRKSGTWLIDSASRISA